MDNEKKVLSQLGSALEHAAKPDFNDVLAGSKTRNRKER